MVRLISKNQNFQVGPANNRLRFFYGELLVGDAKAEEAKAMSGYGTEFATVDDAKWLTDEEKKSVKAGKNRFFSMVTPPPKTTLE